jgi:hypothetical protein
MADVADEKFETRPACDPIGPWHEELRIAQPLEITADLYKRFLENIVRRCPANNTRDVSKQAPPEYRKVAARAIRDLPPVPATLIERLEWS